MPRIFIAHRGIPEVNAGREIQVLSSIPVVERSCTWPPLPSRDRCVIVTTRSRSPGYLLDSMGMQWSRLLAYADTITLQRRGNAVRKRAAGLKGPILSSITEFDDNPGDQFALYYISIYRQVTVSAVEAKDGMANFIHIVLLGSCATRPSPNSARSHLSS